MITNAKWNCIKQLRIFLQQPAAITESQSGSSFIIKSLIIRLLEYLIAKFNAHIDGQDDVLKEVALKMKAKLEVYKSHMLSLSAQMARTLDPQIRNMYDDDGTFL